MPRPFPGFSGTFGPSFRDRQDAAEYRDQVVAWLAAMPKMKRRAFILGALAAAGLTACAPGSATPAPQASPAGAAPTQPPSGEPRRGGTYRSASTSDAVSFHPYKTTDTASSSYQAMVYAGGMTRYHPQTLEHIPNLAERWEISPDKLTYTWHIRQDLKWSDGKPITTEDWLWTWEQVKKPENGFPYRSVTVDPIVDITAPDAYTLVVRIKEPIVPGIEQASPVDPLPKHIWERYDWNDPAQNPEINSPSVSSGPYKLKQWRRDDFVEFEANDSYFRGRPNIDSSIIRIVPDQNVSYQLLMNGEVDSGIVQPTDFDEASANPILKLYQWDPAIASWSYIGFNLRRPVLQDVRVRRAIAFATPRDSISQVVYNNLAKPTYSAFTPTSWVYNPNVPRYDFDPQQAAAELDAAGWRLPPGGRIREKDGQPLSLKLLYGPNTSKVFTDTAVITQQALGDVGIDVQINAMEWGAYLSAKSSEPFDWDLTVAAWQTTLEPHWMFQIWEEAGIPELNAGAYINKRVEELFDQAAVEFDRERRKALYQEIQMILSTDLPYVFLVYSQGWQFLNKRVHPNEPGPLGIAYEREKWWLEDGA